MTLIDNERGFSLLEVVISMFVLIAGAHIVYLYQSQGQEDNTKRSRIFRMQHLMAITTDNIQWNQFRFPPLDKQVYYSCYNSELIPTLNHNNNTGIALTARDSVLNLRDCLKDQQTKKACPVLDSTEGKPLCPHGRYIVLIIPRPKTNRQDFSYYKFLILAMNTKTNYALLRLRGGILKIDEYP